MLALLVPLSTSGATLDIAWIAPTENVDGTVLTDLAGYEVFYGLSSQVYGNSVVVIDETATTYTFTVDMLLAEGDNPIYVAMKAFDDAANYSAFSNEVVKIITVRDTNSPKAPQIVTVTITIALDCPAGFKCNVKD